MIESVETIEKYYEYKSTIMWMLKCSGLWPHYKKDSLHLAVKLFLVAYSFMICLIISYGTLSYALNSFGSSNLIGMSKGFGICLGAFAVNVRVYLSSILILQFFTTT